MVANVIYFLTHKYGPLVYQCFTYWTVSASVGATYDLETWQVTSAADTIVDDIIDCDGDYDFQPSKKIDDPPATTEQAYNAGNTVISQSDETISSLGTFGTRGDPAAPLLFAGPRRSQSNTSGVVYGSDNQSVQTTLSLQTIQSNMDHLEALVTNLAKQLTQPPQNITQSLPPQISIREVSTPTLTETDLLPHPGEHLDATSTSSTGQEMGGGNE